MVASIPKAALLLLLLVQAQGVCHDDQTCSTSVEMTPEHGQALLQTARTSQPALSSTQTDNQTDSGEAAASGEGSLVARTDEEPHGPHHGHEAISDPNGPPPKWVNNPLAEYFFKYTDGYMIWKWHHYFRTYHKHLSSLLPYAKKGDRINMLVIGVQSGGEIGMWQDYFGSNLHYYGIDINPACKQLETAYSNTQIFIGDQGDPTFLLQIKDKILQEGETLHIIIDDGSHINWHQILTFETLYPFLNGDGGVYIAEDVTSSYSDPSSYYREGSSQLLNVPGVTHIEETFVQHMKTRVDWLNGYWAERHNMGAKSSDPFVQSVNEIAFYDAMVVVEKYPHPNPTQEQRGTVSIPYCSKGQKECKR